MCARLLVAPFPSKQSAHFEVLMCCNNKVCAWPSWVEENLFLKSSTRRKRRKSLSWTYTAHMPCFISFHYICVHFCCFYSTFLSHKNPHKTIWMETKPVHISVWFTRVSDSAACVGGCWTGYVWRCTLSWWKPTAALPFYRVTWWWVRGARAGMWSARLILPVPGPGRVALFLSVSLSICSYLFLSVSVGLSAFRFLYHIRWTLDNQRDFSPTYKVPFGELHHNLIRF